MAARNTHRDGALDLTREEQWVLHDVMLDRVEMELHVPEDADPHAIEVLRILGKAEAGTYRFSEAERRIKEELRRCASARDAPESDVPVVERVIDSIE